MKLYLKIRYRTEYDFTNIDSSKSATKSPKISIADFNSNVANGLIKYHIIQKCDIFCEQF